MQAAERWLTAAELERAAGLLGADVRAQHTIGRAMLRVVAGVMTESSPRSVEVAFEEEGKPVLPSAGGLQVSVAHTGRLVAVAAAPRTAVGVDVEGHDQIGPSVTRLARRVLAPAEAARLEGLSQQRVVDEFLRFWTVKEAVSKALGIRLMPAMAGVEVDLGSDEVRLRSNEVGPPADRWSLGQWQLDDGAEWLAVALPAPDVTISSARRFDSDCLSAGRLPGAAS